MGNPNLFSHFSVTTSITSKALNWRLNQKYDTEQQTPDMLFQSLFVNPNSQAGKSTGYTAKSQLQCGMGVFRNAKQAKVAYAVVQKMSMSKPHVLHFQD